MLNTLNQSKVKIFHIRIPITSMRKLLQLSVFPKNKWYYTPHYLNQLAITSKNTRHVSEEVKSPYYLPLG